MLRSWSLGVTIATLGCGAGAEAPREVSPPPVPSVQPTASGAPVAPPGDGRELVLVSSPEPKALVGRTPIWSVSVQRLAKDSKPSPALALGRLAADGKSLTLTRLLPPNGRPVAWPGHPQAVVLEEGDGLNVIEAEKSQKVREAGVWCFSDDGELAAVAVKSPAHLSLYETKGWTKRSELAAKATGSGTFSGARYFEVDQDHALVVDIEASKVLVDRGGYAALSPKQKTLGVLSSTDGGWSVDVYSLAQPDKPLHIKIGSFLFNGLPFVELEGERTLLIRERMPVAHGDFEQSDRFSIDVASGKVSPGKVVAKPDSTPFLYMESAADYRAAVAAVGSFVTKPRVIIPSGGHTKTYSWLQPPGRIAAAVGEPEGDCTSSMLVCSLASPAILFADTKTKKRIAEVALPAKERLVVLSVEHLMDDRMALVCGSEGERNVTYVVDATSGRVASVPNTDCYALVTDKQRTALLAGGSWIDLTRRAEGPWPLLAALPTAPPAVAPAPKIPADTVGLYCRIGEQLAPPAECPAAGI